MTLPAESAKKISEALSTQSLLDRSTVEEVVKALQEQRAVNWNIVLTKQFESEQDGGDEVES